MLIYLVRLTYQYRSLRRFDVISTCWHLGFKRSIHVDMGIGPVPGVSQQLCQPQNAAKRAPTRPSRGSGRTAKRATRHGAKSRSMVGPFSRMICHSNGLGRDRQNSNKAAKTWHHILPKPWPQSSLGTELRSSAGSLAETDGRCAGRHSER